VFLGIAHVDVAQLFPRNLEPLGRSPLIVAIPQRQGVPQEGDRRLGGLPEIVVPRFRNEHLGLERHFVDVFLADSQKQAADVGRAVPLVAHALGCLHERTIGQGAEKRDGVEQVRFADPVHAGNACERAERDVDVDQVLESVDSETG